MHNAVALKKLQKKTFLIQSNVRYGPDPGGRKPNPTPTQNMFFSQAYNAILSMPHYFSVISVVLLAVQDPEDGQEQVQDIEVEADGSRDLLFDLVVADDQLNVH